MSSTLIVPCAGKSSRFNMDKPKWMLTHPNGNLMMMESIYGLDLTNVSRLIITVVKTHIDNSHINLQLISQHILENKGINPEFFILDNFTSSQSETVYQTICANNITGPIFIKDCDNYFNHQIDETNSVCVAKLTKNINAINKSYVKTNKFGFLSGIVEKQVISDKFCVGGYSFRDTNDFKSNYLEIKSIKAIDHEEIYISHIIQKMLLNNFTFNVSQIENYSDWGTIEDWVVYLKDFKTIFIDLDGVLVENSSEYFIPTWGTSGALQNNINTINDLYQTNKVKIIITTSRKEKYRKETIKQLKLLDIKYHSIIFDLPHAQRILINDYSNNNPYPSATSICIKRNSSILNELLRNK